MMQNRKQTAWKKNRKLGDIQGGRMRTKLADNIFNRQHNLLPPKEGEDKPVFIQDNPSKDFYFPVNVEDIKRVLARLPEVHTSGLTHIWLRKFRKIDYEKGDTPQGEFICGSKVQLIVLYPFPKDYKMRFGKNKPENKGINFYKKYTNELKEDEKGWFLGWTEEKVKKYYMESLLLHEIGHSLDSYFKRFWSKAAIKQREDYADTYAKLWSNRTTISFED